MPEDRDRGSSTSGIIGLILLALIGWWIYNTWLKPDYWQGTYELPNDNIVHATGRFDTMEECSGWLASHQPNGSYSRECGKNCKPPETAIGVYMCEETFN